MAVPVLVDSDQNDPPVISSEGNEIYCPLSEQSIVTTFDIFDPDDTTLDALYVQISQGYVPGEDTLILSSDVQGVSSSWNVAEGKLEITGENGGPALITDLIAAVYEILFFSTNPNPVDKYFSFTIGDANFLPNTEHYYFILNRKALHGFKRKQLQKIHHTMFARIFSYYFICRRKPIAAEQMSGTGWIGASDQLVEGEWNWVTGPEGMENGGTGLP